MERDNPRSKHLAASGRGQHSAWSARHLPGVLALSLLSVACAPNIGDDCETSADCDIQGTRVCDRTMPGGYCTIQGCERGTCPDEAMCVLFRPEPVRLSSSWCMARCSSHGQCRDGYRCVRADQLGQDLAISLDSPRGRFCAVTEN